MAAPAVTEPPETDWTRRWEATLRRTRWVEKDGMFYPKGVAAERMNNRPDFYRIAAIRRPSFAPVLALAIWKPRKA